MKYLTIGPGGFGIFSFMGYIYKIRDQLKDVEEISGTSAGAMLALLLASGKDINDIINFFFKFDFKKYYKFSMKNFIKKYGFININEIKEEFINFLGGNPTFKDLEKKLIIGIYNVNYSKTEYFSSDNYPDMPALDAVCMSMSIPFVFISKKFKKNYYIDGGIFEKTPLGPFIGKKKEDVLAIQIEFKVYDDKKISNFKDFFFFIYFALINKACIAYDNKLFTIIKIQQDNNINLLDFKMSEETKMKLFFLGFNSKL